MKVHNVRYEKGGFYLTIDNLRGYFNFSNNLCTLTMLFDDINQQNKYHQVWKDIFKIINGGHGELKLHEKIRLYYNYFPIKQVFKIHSIILYFNPKKLSIEKVCAINDKLEHIYYVKYDKDPSYLITDDLKGHFKYSKEKDRKELEFIIEDQRKKKFITKYGIK